MRAQTLHPGEPAYDAPLVRRLIAAQFPRWARLPVRRLEPAGTSNVMFRLGEERVVRLPRTAGAAADIDKECAWLPRLAPSLPVAVPVPLGRGRPAEGCPWPWAVYRWIEGAPAVARLAAPDLLADGLARFVTALHAADPAGGPPSYRAEPLAARDAVTREAIEGLRGDLDAEAVAQAWEESVAAPAPAGPPGWIHADLQPANLLLAGGRLTAVIDFGCLGLGDPAVDLIAAWYVLPAGVRDRFRAAVGAGEAAWARGRGWALSIALLELRYYRDTSPFMAGVARQVIRAVLDDHRAAGAGRRRPRS
ncbi:aminoglycoside phosphotransferase family protein [Streptomyces sp. NPDC003374]